MMFTRLISRFSGARKAANTGSKFDAMNSHYASTLAGLYSQASGR